MSDTEIVEAKRGRPSQSERQELIAMVGRAMTVIQGLQEDIKTLQFNLGDCRSEIAALKVRCDGLQERLSVAAGQYRQQAMSAD